MANINSSIDEILTELGDSFDADIAPRKITRSTANKIWLMLRAFSRGLYGLYQVVAALKYRFDPLYCTDEELESTMRLVGTKRQPGKTSLVTITIWNNHGTESKTLPVDMYYYTSANGVLFSLLVFEPIVIPPNAFAKRDFYSSIGEEFAIGAFPVSANSDILVTNGSGDPIDEDLSFDCEDNINQLGREEETLFEARQRILTDNQRQEVLYLLEENLRSLPNIHECTILSNKGIEPTPSPYLQDDGVTPVPILPQTIFIIMTGSPTDEFARQVLTLSPFLTTIPEGVEDYRVTTYNSPMYVGGSFPVYHVPHRIKNFDVIIQYGFASSQIGQTEIEAALLRLLLSFKANTRFKEIISVEDFSHALSSYQNPSVRILSITFDYDGEIVSYMQFDKTQIARLNNISFQQVVL